MGLQMSQQAHILDVSEKITDIPKFTTDTNIQAPQAPSIVPEISRDTYFQIKGMISELELGDQKLLSVKHNIWHFTDYTFFWTPRKFFIQSKKAN